MLGPQNLREFFPSSVQKNQNPHSHTLLSPQIQGYRIRLHFDGYPECYDFWVNADSWDIKPAGWCEKMGHKLLLPKGKHTHTHTHTTHCLPVCSTRHMVLVLRCGECDLKEEKKFMFKWCKIYNIYIYIYIYICIYIYIWCKI